MEAVAMKSRVYKFVGFCVWHNHRPANCILHYLVHELHQTFMNTWITFLLLQSLFTVKDYAVMGANNTGYATIMNYSLTVPLWIPFPF
jgi:hypothetical protein